MRRLRPAANLYLADIGLGRVDGVEGDRPHAADRDHRRLGAPAGTLRTVPHIRAWLDVVVARPAVRRGKEAPES